MKPSQLDTKGGPVRRILIAVTAVIAVSVPGFPASADSGPVVTGCGNAATAAGSDPYRTTLEMPCEYGDRPTAKLCVEVDQYGNPLRLTIRMMTQTREQGGEWTTVDAADPRKVDTFSDRCIHRTHRIVPDEIITWEEHYAVRELAVTKVCEVDGTCHRERAKGFYQEKPPSETS